ncbi:MAG: hypothetical protein J1E01_09635 [Acetatifactor sp.]|nr:hypothetical protein [Acetatifactor sp.]
MSRNNLVKQFNVVEAEETRIIDTNELLRRRREKLPPRIVTPEDGDSFVSGLGAEEVELPAGGEGLPESGVIKAGEDIQAMLEQAREEAQAIVDRAHREAQDLIANAVAKAETEKKSIMDQARQQGYEAGQGKAQAEADVLRKEFQEKARQLEAEYQQMIDELEPRFVDVITSVYEHIFQVELGENRGILEHLISNTMHRLEGGGNFLIHVSKEDYSDVTMQKQQILAGTASGIGTVEIVEDMTLGKNECLIETDSGIFDCSLGTQLAGLKQKLMLLSWSKED